MLDIEKLKADVAELIAWLKANQNKLGSPEFRRATLVHALLNDLARFNGGTSQQYAYAMQKLKEIKDGTHPDSL